LCSVYERNHVPTFSKIYSIFLLNLHESTVCVASLTLNGCSSAGSTLAQSEILHHLSNLPAPLLDLTPLKKNSKQAI
jgi:hypothetical protein